METNACFRLFLELPIEKVFAADFENESPYYTAFITRSITPYRLGSQICIRIV